MEKGPPAAVQLGVGCHSPGFDEDGRKNAAGAEPSLARAAIIAAAAASPTAMPAVLAELFGIAASELALRGIQARRAGREVILEDVMRRRDRRCFRRGVRRRL